LYGFSFESVEQIWMKTDYLPQVEPYTAPEISESPKPAQSHDGWLAIAEVAWDRRGHVCRLTIAGSLLALLVALLIPARYASTTKLMPPETKSPAAALAMLSGLNSTFGAAAADLLGTKTSGAVFVEVLKSRTVQDRLIDKFDLRRVYWDRYWEDARKDLSRHTDISEDRKSGVITISVTDRNPERAASIARAYVDELDKLTAELSTSAARRERMFIEQRLATVQRDLEAAEKDFGQFASKNTALDIKEQTKAMVGSAAALQGELIAAQSELQAIQQVYTDDNVRVRSGQARIAELQRQLQRIEGADIGETTNPKEVYPAIRKLPLLGVQWADLYRRQKVQETLFELLSQQYELAKIEEAKEIPSVKVLEQANVPERKSTPHRSIIVLVGILVAFAVAVFWIFIEHTWKATHESDSRKIFLHRVVAGLRSDLKSKKALHRRRLVGF
jgi:uncharacterized protein involved in exopolysaccharide biosynthesis